MKRKALVFSGLMSVLALLSIGLSSHVASEEDPDDARKREAVVHPCTYDCWYQDAGGNWYVIQKAGTYQSCPRVDYVHDCNTIQCLPIIPC